MEIFYKTLFYSSKLQFHLKKDGQLPYFIDFFEKIVLKMLKNYENPERFAVLNESLNGNQNSDFQMNMRKLLMNLNSPSQTPKNLIESFQHLNLFSPISGPDPSKTIITHNNLEIDNPLSIPVINNSEREIPHLKSPLKVPVHHENLMITSNNMNKNSTENNPSNFQKKNLKIPLLQIPVNITENCPVISRSTRRADPYKSFSTTSNRFSNSIDLAGKNLENLSKPGYINKNLGQENNISVLDNENSLFFEDNTPMLGMGLVMNSGKNSNELSSTEKMRILANQLGIFNIFSLSIILRFIKVNTV